MSAAGGPISTDLGGRHRPTLLLLMVLCLSASVFAAAGVEPVEMLNEQTGATVTRAHAPLIFAHDRSSLASSARDYVSLTAVEVDRGGRLQTFIVGFFWSMNDGRGQYSGSDHGVESIELVAGGRPLQLIPIHEVPQELQNLQQFLAPPSSHARRVAYPATREMLRAIAGSKSLSMTVASGSAANEAKAPYSFWGDGQQELAAFVSRAEAFK